MSVRDTSKQMDLNKNMVTENRENSKNQKTKKFKSK